MTEEKLNQEEFENEFEDDRPIVLDKSEIDELARVISAYIRRRFGTWEKVRTPDGENSILYLARALLMLFGKWHNIGRVLVALGGVYFVCKPDDLSAVVESGIKPEGVQDGF